jgi:hypothetical protein
MISRRWSERLSWKENKPWNQPSNWRKKTVYTRIGKLEFKNGYPSKDTVAKLYDEADLNRAVAAYRFFYPNVSVAGLFKGLEPFAPVDNKSFFIMESTPKQVLFTPNSDTPYAAIPLDLRAGLLRSSFPLGRS